MDFTFLSKKGTKDPQRLLVQKQGYGKNWPKQRKLALERDNYTCQTCNYKGKKKGRFWDVHVHHKRKIRLFANTQTKEIDYQKANDLNNLITLCVRCHKWYDGHDSGNGFRRF